MNDRELLQMALDALKKYPIRYWGTEAQKHLQARLSQCDRCGEVNPAEIHTCSPKESAHSIAWWNHEVNKAFVNGYDKGRASKEPPCKTGSQCIGGRCERCAEPEPVAWMWESYAGGGWSSRGIGFEKTDIPVSIQIPLYTAPPRREAEPEPVACPFPCGWKKMLSIIINDGAFLARGLTEGEPVTGHQREIVMRLIDYAKTMASHGMTARPRREWVGLTDEEINGHWINAMWNTEGTMLPIPDFARAIEAALKAKNQ